MQEDALGDLTRTRLQTPSRRFRIKYDLKTQAPNMDLCCGTFPSAIVLVHKKNLDANPVYVEIC